MARLVPAPLSQLGATEAILAAVAANMFSKLMIAAGIGRGRFAGEVAAMTGACWLAALAALWAALVLAGP
jgi:cytosine/adenosine deaminase-related metal-dependent hydrolase